MRMRIRWIVYDLCLVPRLLPSLRSLCLLGDGQPENIGYGFQRANIESPVLSREILDRVVDNILLERAGKPNIFLNYYYLSSARCSMTRYVKKSRKINNARGGILAMDLLRPVERAPILGQNAT